MTFIVHQVQKLTNLIESSLSKDLASILYCIFSILIMLSGMILIKLNSGIIAVSQVLTLRGVFELIANWVADSQAFDSQFSKIDHKTMNLVLVRNMGANIKFFCMQMLLYKIPMSQIAVLDLSSIFFAGMVDVILNKTKYYLYEGITALVTAFGVILIVDPALFGFEVPPTKNTIADQEYAHGLEKVFYVGLFVLTQITWAVSVGLVKKLRGVNVFALNLPSGMILILYGSFNQIVGGNFMNIGISTTIFFMVVLGFVGFASKGCYIRGVQLGKAGKVTTLSSLNVVFTLIFEVFYLDEYPSWPGVFGSVIIIAATIYLCLKKDETKK